MGARQADTDLDGVYELQDVTGDGLVTGADDNADIGVDFFEFAPSGSGVHHAQVSGIDAHYTIEFSSETAHEMALVEAVEGKYDIGGFNLQQLNETPDQLFDYTLNITDFDADTDSSAFQVLVDGTGIYDDGVFDLTPLV